MKVDLDGVSVSNPEESGGGIEAQCKSFQCRNTMEEGNSSFKTFPDCFPVLSDIFLPQCSTRWHQPSLSATIRSVNRPNSLKVEFRLRSWQRSSLDTTVRIIRNNSSTGRFLALNDMILNHA
jgi:hypothetical protein